MNNFLVQFVNILVTVLYVAILARVIVSWIAPMGSRNPIITLIYQVTEPILAPLRRIVPRIGMLDLTPMIAIVILVAIQQVIRRLAS